MVKLIFLSGSVRKGSLNERLARLAFTLTEQTNIESEYIDLRDYDMPIYNGDLEEKSGLPENAKKLKKKFVEADGFFIASPEYNSAFSPLLKNTIDWISRPEDKKEAPLIAFRGKVAAISAVSPGALGGLRGLVFLRQLLANISVQVIPSQLAVSNGIEAFGEDGGLKQDMQKKLFNNVIEEFTETARKLAK